MVVILGMEDELSVIAGRGGHPTVEFNSSWQNKSVVVVGMLADEVDTAGGTVNRWGRGEARAELFLKLKRVCQRSILLQTCFRQR